MQNSNISRTRLTSGARSRVPYDSITINSSVEILVRLPLDEGKRRRGTDSGKKG